MSNFVISPCFLENIQDRRYIADILYKFIQTNPYKVIIDSNNIIMKAYERIASNNPEIASWLHYISILYPPAVEKVNVKYNIEYNDITDYLIITCTFINGPKQIIFYTLQCNIKYSINDEFEINCNGNTIKLYDKDSALNYFTDTINLNIDRSIIATGNSTIRKGEVNG